MELRRLGRTGLEVSVLGFGCGAVGGLMVGGDPADQARAVAMAIEAGVNYFDTAPLYGEGRSEANLGRVLEALRADVFVGTKVRIEPDQRGRLGQAVEASVEGSLRRLRRQRVDLIQLHNPLSEAGEGAALTPAEVIEQIAPAFARLRAAGKAAFCGITATGKAAANHAVVASGAFDTAQTLYNLLNPSIAEPVAAGFPAPDYRQLLDAMARQDVGSLGIRVMAAGILSGQPRAASAPHAFPLGSGPDFDTDLKRARLFQPLVDGGQAGSLAEASLRYVISGDRLDTAILGFATLDEVRAAVAAVAKGPLPAAGLEQVRAIQAGFVA